MLKMNWKTVIGNQEKKPDARDTASSPTTAYIRRNIKRVLVNQADNSYYAWQYDEAALTLEQLAEYDDLVAQVESPAMEELRQKNDILMAALADIYEQLEGQAGVNEAILSGLADIYEMQEGE